MAATKPPATGLAVTAGLPAIAQNMDTLFGAAGVGPKIGLADVIMPRLAILQTLSPACNERKAEYVRGAKPGLILNTATLEVIDHLTVIPCHYIRHHIEWKPNRGGFVHDHGEDASIMKRVKGRDEKNMDILDNGNIIQETPTWYCLDVNNDLRQIIISMPRTNMKASKSWMSQATSETINHPVHGKFQPPLFFRAWDVTTFERSEDGNDWFIWSVARGPSVVDTDESGALVLPAHAMQAAISFRDLLMSGEIRASADSFDDGMGGRSGDDGATASQAGDKF